MVHKECGWKDGAQAAHISIVNTLDREGLLMEGTGAVIADTYSGLSYNQGTSGAEQPLIYAVRVLPHSNHAKQK